MSIRSKYTRLILVILITMLAGCTTPEKLALKRVEKTKRNTGDIVVGVSWPSSVVESDFHDGMKMALDEINENGLLGGRKMKLIVRDNGGTPDGARKVAREFTRNTNMIAVIGHFYSDLALPASITYESGGLLFITPDAMLPALSQHGLKRFFRIAPTNVLLAKKAAEFTHLKNYKRPLIVLVRSHWGKNITHNYEIELSRYNLDVAGKFSFFYWEEDFRRIFSKIKKTEHDIIFLAVAFPDGAFFIRDARKRGITSPFLVIDFNKTQYLNLLKPDLHGIVNIEPFDWDSDRKVVQDYIKKFKEIYGRMPEGSGANGYDALKLLADAITTSNTTNPYTLAEDMHFYDNWEGVTGILDFDDTGDPLDKEVHVKEYLDGNYVEVALHESATEDMYYEFHSRLKDEISDYDIHITREKNNKSILITIMDMALFQSGTVEFTQIGQNMLDKISKIVNSYPERSVVIDGHTDSEPVSLRLENRYPTNWELSTGKADLVTRYFIDKGVKSDLITVSGHASNVPLTKRTDIEADKFTDARIEIRLSIIELDRP